MIILCPQDGTAAAAAADEANKAGVKVISYDRLILDTTSVDYYVTFDSVSVGEAQAQYLVDHATGKGNPLYLYAGAATDNNAFLFFEGAWETLQPKIADGTFVIKNSSEAVGLQSKPTLTHDEEAKIIGQVTTNWDFAVAKNLAQANLTKATAADKGNVFILAPNDGTARSIADVFAADKDVKSYVITGQDAEKRLDPVHHRRQAVHDRPQGRPRTGHGRHRRCDYLAVRRNPSGDHYLQQQQERRTCQADRDRHRRQEQRQVSHHRLRLLQRQRLYRTVELHLSS